MQADTLKTNFTRRYTVAISLIALLSTVAFYILNLALKTSDSTALIVNISGKQRMLSQRVASLSQQYHLYTYIKKNPDELPVIQTALKSAITEMCRANQALSSGHLNKQTVVELSDPITNIYFGDVNLKKRVEAYLKLAEQIPEAESEEDSLYRLGQLLALSHTLLPDLNSAVLQYQQEGEANIEAIRDLETLAWALTLFTLLLEVLFIFQPMANKIRELFQSIEWNEQNLQEQIKIKTLSLEQANLKLLHAASHDPLTGLKNRLNMEQELESLIIRYHENFSPYGVAMLDIDWFKKINDTHGHDAGDFVLNEIAKILTDNVREQDSVYRIGGEEFIILFTRIAKEQVLDKIERIRLHVQKHPFLHNNQVIRVTISGGIFHPDIIDAANPHEILKYADSALYEAKHLGRNRIVQVRPDHSA